MRRKWWMAFAFVSTFGVTISDSQAQTLGDVGAASGIAAGMNAQSAGGTMAVGQRAANDARRLGQASNNAAAAAMGAAPGGAPGMPGAAAGGAPGVEGAGGTVTVTTVVREEPLRWGPETGTDYLRELLARPARSTSRTTTVQRRSPRAQAAYARRVARMTPAQRKRAVAAKYKKPPVLNVSKSKSIFAFRR